LQINRINIQYEKVSSYIFIFNTLFQQGKKIFVQKMTTEKKNNIEQKNAKCIQKDYKTKMAKDYKRHKLQKTKRKC